MLQYRSVRIHSNFINGNLLRFAAHPGCADPYQSQGHRSQVNKSVVQLISRFRWKTAVADTFELSAFECLADGTHLTES